MANAYLPKNRTVFEAAVADAGAFREIDPDAIRTLYDVDQCPSEFLPYLGWALSVDFWELAIDDDQRRSLIRDAITWHRKRGTPWAIKEALAAFGYPVLELIEHRGYLEQWKAAGGHLLDASWTLGSGVRLAVPGNAAVGELLRRSALNHWAEYSIRLNMTDGFWTKAAQQKIRRLAESFAPERCHLIALIASLEVRFSQGVTVKSEGHRSRVRLQGKHRFQPLARRTLDGNWTLTGDSDELLLNGWSLDGRRLRGRHLTGTTLDNSNIDLRNKVTMRMRASAVPACSAFVRVNRRGVITEIPL